MRVSLLAGLISVLLALPVVVSADMQQLERYFSEVDTLEGTFTQVTYDEDEREIERSRGHMRIARPNRFNWQYETPFEQQIVADGERIWVYDVELLQVSVRPLEEVLGSGPALLLSGELDALEEQFEISEREGWLVLEPRDGGWGIELARLRFRDGVPVEVVVADGLGQINVLELDDLRVNQSIDAAHFRFDVPDGVDVLGEDEEW